MTAAHSAHFTKALHRRAKQEQDGASEESRWADPIRCSVLTSLGFTPLEPTRVSRVAALLLKVTRLRPGRIAGPIKTGKPGEPNQMRRIRLVIADRRPIVLQGFATLFATERDFEIVASCINGADCLEAVRTLAPDVALVEDGFPDLTASAMLAAVNAESLRTRLVFYTASIARGDLAAAVAAGACTAIPMREEPENLLQSLRLVAPNAHRRPARQAMARLAKMAWQR